MPLLRYAVGAAGGIDGLALNCMDRAEEEVKVCVERVPPQEGPWAGTPVYEKIDRQALADTLERELGAPVLIEGWGQTAADRRWRSPKKKRIMR